MRNLIVILTFILFFSACKKSSSTTSTQAIGTNSGSCIIGKWPDSYLPLDVKMSSEFSGDYTNVNLVSGLNPLEQMAAAWNDPVSGSKVLITTPFPIAAGTGYSTTSAFRDSEIGIYKSHTWFSGVSSSALAITQFYGVVTVDPALGGQYISLTHADIIVNYRDFGTRLTMTGTPAREFDLPTVVLHEMGHLLGLCHESTKTSIMAPYYITTQHGIQAYDKALIKNLYVDGAISALQNTNANALAAPVGSEVTGVIELESNGTCSHYVNGKKIYQHQIEIRK